MKKIILSGIAAGVVIFVASMGVSSIFGMIFPSLGSEYMTKGLFRPWSDPVMSLYFIYPFVMGLLLAWFWNKTKKVWKTGIDFGISFWFVASIPGMLITYSSFPLSLMIVISWSVGGLVGILGSGMVLEKLNK